MWSMFVRSLGFTKRDLAVLADISEGFSGSDIQEVALRLERKRVTTSAKQELHSAFRTLRNIASSGDATVRRFLAELSDAPPEKVARVLRSRDSKLYSHAVVARLLGVS
jgi:hypothetical protein